MDLDVTRFWTDMIGRTEGPMTFRFFLQPAMGLFFAVRDGYKDAKIGRTPYFWTILHDPTRRRASFHEGLRATTRIFLLGVAMDVVYQFRVFGGFQYPLETLFIAVVLGMIPYFVLRGLATRFFAWRRARHQAQ